MDRREAIEASIEALEANPEAAAPAEQSAIAEIPPSAPEAQEAAAPDRSRGPDGRFAPKDGGQPETAPRRSAPVSWKKDYHAHWEKLDPALQEYIEQREKEAADGIGKHRGNWERARPYYEAIQPFEPIARQYGLDPVQLTQQLWNAHRTLALGSPEEKQQIFNQLAQQYGIQMGGDPTINWLTRELQQTKQQVTSWQRQQEEAQQAALQSEISAFAKEHPHFEALKETMAQLLTAGAASNLKDAHDKALRLNDELWTQEQERQRSAQEAQRRQQADAAAKRARTAAVSPRSASPSADMASRAGNKDRRSALSEAFDAHAGRV